MRKITIEPTGASYASSYEALEEAGYKHVGTITYMKNFKWVKRDLFEKAGKQYVYLGMDNYNTTIYEIYLGKASTLQGEYRTQKF